MTAKIEVLKPNGDFLYEETFATNQEAADAVVELTAQGLTVNHEPEGCVNPTMESHRPK